MRVEEGKEGELFVVLSDVLCVVLCEELGLRWCNEEDELCVR